MGTASHLTGSYRAIFTSTQQSAGVDVLSCRPLTDAPGTPVRQINQLRVLQLQDDEGARNAPNGGSSAQSVLVAGRESQLKPSAELEERVLDAVGTCRPQVCPCLCDEQVLAV